MAKWLYRNRHSAILTTPHRPKRESQRTAARWKKVCMSASLLAHLIPRIVDKAEPAATKALAYVLRASPDVAREFVTIVGQTGINPFTPGRIEAEQQHGDSKPDLTIYDTDGAVRTFVENKFWSGLTDAQPVVYLEKLPGDTPSVLLFIVPHQRMCSVWSEMKERCRHREIGLVRETKTNNITWAEAGNKRTMANHELEIRPREVAARGRRHRKCRTRAGHRSTSGTDRPNGRGRILAAGRG